MKHDDNVAILELLKTPCLIDGYFVSICIGDGDITHGNADAAIDYDGCVVDGDFAPTLQGKTGVIREIRIAADEVRDRTILGRPKPLRIPRESGFEEDRPIFIVVKVLYGSDGNLSCFFGAFLIVSRGNSDERIAPFLLRGDDITFGDIVIGGND